jgi:hypothetical protein
MTDSQVNLGDIAAAPPTVIPDTVLSRLLVEAELLREAMVFGRDPLRLFRYSRRYLVQETSDREEILLRGYASRDDAEDFLTCRLEDHERQWDG